MTLSQGYWITVGEWGNLHRLVSVVGKRRPAPSLVTAWALESGRAGDEP